MCGYEFFHHAVSIDNGRLTILILKMFVIQAANMGRGYNVPIYRTADKKDNNGLMSVVGLLILVIMGITSDFI